VIVPWRIGKRTGKGWQIQKQTESGSWKTVGHSDRKQDAEASIRARRASEYGNKK